MLKPTIRHLAVVALTAAITLTALVGCQPPPGAAQTVHVAATAPASRPVAKAPTQHEIDVWTWYTELNRQADYARLVAFAAAVAHAAEIRNQPCTRYSSSCWIDGLEVCNGRDRPTCYIAWRESRFRWWVRNSASTAAGYYGMLLGWARKCGYNTTLDHVGPAAQVSCGAWLWNRGVDNYRTGQGPHNWR